MSVFKHIGVNKNQKADFFSINYYAYIHKVVNNYLFDTPMWIVKCNNPSKLGFETARSSLKWQSVFKQTKPLKEKTYFNKLFRYDSYHMYIMSVMD